MRFSSAIVAAAIGICATSISAFTPSRGAVARSITSSSLTQQSSPLTQLNQYASATAGAINLADEYAQRDVYSMEEFATQYGLQKAPGVELYSDDGSDYQLITQQPIGAGQTCLYVPSDIVISSEKAYQEFGNEIQQAEQVLVQIDQGTAQRLPLFRLMVKILAEYDQGENSAFFPWLNSLPRVYYNGVSMTNDCFSCLPPYAGWLTSTEKANYDSFVTALRQGYVQLQSVNDDTVTQWAYNVALTRFQEVWSPQRAKLIAPMADMLNHSAEPNCEITFDDMGNCEVTAMYDIQPGTPLTISYGDPTNPTPIFAQFGFLPADCATLFCKAMHLEPYIKELGIEFRELLIQTETGEIAPKVWDLFLYEILVNNDPGAAEAYFVAVKCNDEATKQQYQDQYFQYTLDSMKQHVYSILSDVDTLTAKAQNYDLNTHPRVPVIVAHNNLVRDTFTMTAALLEQMG
mmetsp:Transcript_30635/g.45050  ORF Transcript_30635/g.45050 Transcript_30635/m.45050 type:complete len:461 (-) Transcript_30635:187-1569(-)